MLGVPFFFVVVGALALTVWTLVLTVHLSSRGLNRPRVLTFLLGTSVALACLSTSAGRLGLPVGSAGLLGVVVATIVTGSALAAWASPLRPSGRGSGALLTLALAMSGLAVISFFVNGYEPSMYWNHLIALGILPGTIYLASTLGDSPRQLLNMVFAIAATVMYVSLALAAVAPGIAFGVTNQDERRLVLGPLVWRLSGVTGHPNYLAFIALIVLVIAVASPIRARRLHVLAALLTIGLTEARSALLSLAMVTFVLFVMSGRNRVARAALVTPVAILVLVFGTRWVDQGTPLADDVATNGRFRVWDSVFEHFDERLLLGWGPVAFRENSGTPFLETGLIHSHNQALQALVEGGLIGLALLVLFSLVILRLGVAQSHEPVYLALATILLASYPTQIFLSPHLWGGNIGAVPALLLMPVFVAAGRRQRADRDQTSNAETLTRSRTV